MRENHPRIGKEKLKVLLDRFCQQRGIRPVSASTIGNIIRRHKFSSISPRAGYVTTRTADGHRGAVRGGATG